MIYLHQNHAGKVQSTKNRLSSDLEAKLEEEQQGSPVRRRRKRLPAVPISRRKSSEEGHHLDVPEPVTRD
jgi:hypothetical protein